MLLYVIRHGQTDYNREERLQGARDIPLNDTGRSQARANGRTLASIPDLEFPLSQFDWVASPLGRTRETMELVREAAGLEPGGYRTDPLLIELSFGDWEGQTLDEVAVHSHHLIIQRDEGKWDFRPPGERAESYAMLAHRIDRFLTTLTGPTICVAHGGVVRTLFNRIGNVAGDDAAMIDIPQDRVLKIKDGAIGWV
ncbi:MAG: phosphoglycerate mutase family protein [Hoeflea sp.]|uniref:histidine phosphatase family protein n=1 Tax=Hoeflea sp. TaxID=1940281 RepID=UPI001DF648B6|nr:histidine phosphatase family protein [Hoeflea sp.]MBU4527724.1 phosphoglycerate mutase family protein [Alphaproteobacteria bacterium]MBU4546241.1 phosphoglycerate mutase family protein [Alphaproteobacteria bacterium]MBU4553074.1 phosphoglycerate mutase family protein [Alphaproteobacteria bacterium]MBV1724146.1 phosphoglycerate mutase family protein [Hoeflea sp.]MBV1759831.1 phosphoglycerate mutase family protein [Hoeflea sp.]